MALVAGRFPYHGLRYPKSDERPPFQTIEEFEGGSVTIREKKRVRGNA
jgi:hypothetical protein